MPHAESSLVPSSIETRTAFWAHVYGQLDALLDGQRNWVSNLSNASSLIYNALLAFEKHFGADDRAVNWCGFYLESHIFPGPKRASHLPPVLLLAPFSGKPACQLIFARAGKGVCADAFVSRKPLLVPDVDAYPGHIACDGETRSELVLPLIHKGRAIGVLDLDCLALDGFTDDDVHGLQKIVDLIVRACDW